MNPRKRRNLQRKPGHVLSVKNLKLRKKPQRKKLRKIPKMMGKKIRARKMTIARKMTTTKMKMTTRVINPARP
jgi:hypothetical protein